MSFLILYFLKYLCRILQTVRQHVMIFQFLSHLFLDLLESLFCHKIRRNWFLFFLLELRLSHLVLVRKFIIQEQFLSSFVRAFIFNLAIMNFFELHFSDVELEIYSRIFREFLSEFALHVNSHIPRNSYNNHAENTKVNQRNWHNRIQFKSVM